MNLTCSPLLFGPCRKETYRGQRSAFPSETSLSAPLILAHRGPIISWLVDDRVASALAESGAYSPDRALPGPPRQCSLPLACHHLPKGTKLELGRGVHLGNTILNQPYRRRVSTNRLNREDRQFAASLEGEPGPTLVGKTLLNSYPKSRFRRWWICSEGLDAFIFLLTGPLFPKRKEKTHFYDFCFVTVRQMDIKGIQISAAPPLIGQERSRNKPTPLQPKQVDR